uniref:MRN complex-interacting protein isoform X2 n=1 Tax=Geotrypetes seraphini TaxID=260995 RepID=A0A6P8Q6J7_GEOSA|nr:MRN complex-interacting protein isoform X2 [Geotrypetes seraphini]
MVQEFQVLACFSCKCFQVHQSYGQGSGADCRHHVQKLNMMRGEMMQEAERTAGSPDNLNKTTPSELDESANLQREQCPVSRWSKYVEKNNEELNKEHEEEEILYTDRQQFYLDMKNRAKEKRKCKKTFHGYDGKDCDDESNCYALTYEAKKVNQCKANFRASKWGRFDYNFKYDENDSTYAKSKTQKNWAESESCSASMALPIVQSQEQCSIDPFKDEDVEHFKYRGKTSLGHSLKSFSGTVSSTKTTSAGSGITGSKLGDTPSKELKDNCIWKDYSKLDHEKPRESSTKSQPSCFFSTPMPCSSFASFSTPAKNQASALCLFQTDDDFDGDL